MVRKRQEVRLEKLREEKKKRLEPPEGYISYKVFLDILGITREGWRQIKKNFPVPTREKVGKKFYYLKADVDVIKEQRGNKATKPRVSIRELKITSLKPAPEGFMTVAQICKTLEISGSTWYKLKVKNKPTSYRIGSGTFYKKEDIDKIAIGRQQKASERMTTRSERKPQFDKEFEEMIEGSEEQNSRDLDLFSLHLTEIGKIPVEVQKHKLWGAKISSGQLAVRVLENLLNSNLLNSSQERQIEQILETPKAKYFSKEFKLLIKSKLEKEKSGKIRHEKRY